MAARPVVLITGGSRGIGAATARLAAKRGYDVAVNYTANAAAAQRTVADVESAGGRAVAIRADVAVEAEVENLFTEAEKELGPIAALVNSAGIAGRASRLDAVATETLRAAFDINILGSHLCARAAVRRMSTNHGGKGGSIVNLSSVAASIGGPGEWVWYAACKGAIDSFTLGLAREVAKEGIRVNAVAPGLIDTEIHDESQTGIVGRLAKLSPTVPIGRSGSAEEVAETILFLMSDAASYVTGAILKVSGGR